LKATDTFAPEQLGPSAGARSLGILGGTLNPPHLGHLALARSARAELGLEHVLLMPAHRPPHKVSSELPSPEQRLRMCELLVADAQGVSASALEIERGGASYTVDTLQALHAMHPEARLTFIMGADTACTLGSWHEPAQLLELAELAVATRSGASRDQVLATVAAIADLPRSAGTDSKVCFLEMGPIEVSSSLVRERVARGESIAQLVGPAVAGYIAAQDLYRTPIEAAS
jgi:nicotinate-nucleotide adenylyltransferase